MISLLLASIMVFSLVPALFVRDGYAADDKYVKNSTAAPINIYKEPTDASQVIGTLPVGGVAKYVSSSGAVGNVNYTASSSLGVAFGFCI